MGTDGGNGTDADAVPGMGIAIDGSSFGSIGSSGPPGGAFLGSIQAVFPTWNCSGGIKLSIIFGARAMTDMVRAVAGVIFIPPM